MAQNDSSKQTIVIAAGLYPPDVGGPATYAAMLVAELPRYGYEVVVVPFHTVRTYSKLLRHVSYLWRLWRVTPRQATVLALDGVSVGLPALIVSRLRRASLLVRLGGDFAWEQGRQRFEIEGTLDEFTNTPRRQYSWPVRLLAWVQTKVVRQARCVIVPSQYLATIVRQWPGVAADKVEVVYSVLNPLPGGAPAIEHRQYTLLTACRLVPWKGVGGVLDVLAALPDDVVLRVAGDGPERLALEKKAEQLGIAKRVTFLGQLSRQALRAEKTAAHVFVLNTSYEGLSHELLEVMAIRTPVITTPVGGNPELITDHATGLLVPVNDTTAWVAAVAELRRDEQLVSRLTQAAYERTDAFTAEQSLQALHQLLQS